MGVAAQLSVCAAACDALRYGLSTLLSAAASLVPTMQALRTGGSAARRVLGWAMRPCMPLN